jgi:protein-tyrosine phosphatase
MLVNNPQVCTSEKYPLRLDWVDQSVALTIAPGKKAPSVMHDIQWDRDMDMDLKVIQDAGISVVVTLMKLNEMLMYGIGDLGHRIKALGWDWYHFPIEDGGIPSSMMDVFPLVQDILVEVSQGKKVLIHCRGGLGRTGTIAGCYLVAKGMSVEDTLKKLVETRGEFCPENDMQKDFIRNFVKML